MTKRILTDDAEALEYVRSIHESYLYDTSSKKRVYESLEALDRAISALRSAQDVERRIVEARIAGIEEGVGIVKGCTVTSFSGQSTHWKDVAVLQKRRIAELRSLPNQEHES